MIAGLLLVSACGSAEVMPSLELGREAEGRFVPLNEGEALPLERGNQGGVHVSLALLVVPAAVDRFRLTMEATDPETGELVTRSRYLLPFSGEPDSRGAYEVRGLRIVFVSEGAIGNRSVYVSSSLAIEGEAPLEDVTLIRCLPPD